MADAANRAQLSRARGKKVPQVVVEQRVGVVFGLLVAGTSRSQIVQAVAAAWASEDKERQAWTLKRDALPEKERAKAKPPKPWLWGDTEPALRTVDRYISVAKRLIAEDGKRIREAQLSDVVGLQWSRINALYQRAFADRQYNVCARLIEEVNEMFGLKGLVLLGQGTALPQGQQGDSTPTALPSGGDGEVHDAPETALTGAQAIAELKALLGQAAMRRLAAGSKSGEAVKT